jgi:hypothetical protein
LSTLASLNSFIIRNKARIQSQFSTISTKLTALYKYDKNPTSVTNCIKDLSNIAHAQPITTNYLSLTADEMPYGVKYYLPSKPSTVLTGTNKTFRTSGDYRTYSLDENEYVAKSGTLYPGFDSVSSAYFHAYYFTNNEGDLFRLGFAFAGEPYVSKWIDSDTYYSGYGGFKCAPHSIGFRYGTTDYMPIAKKSSISGSFGNYQFLSVGSALQGSGHSAPTYPVEDKILQDFINADNKHVGLYQNKSQTSAFTYYVDNQVNHVSSECEHIILAGYSEGLYYSVQGTTSWTKVLDYYILKVIYANDLFIACTNTNGILYSRDGKNWTQTNVSSIGIRDMYHNGTMFIAATTAGAYYSYTGKSWTLCTNLNASYDVYSVVYGGSYWVASTRNNGLWYSVNGISWTKNTSYTTYSFTHVYYMNSYFYACGTSGVMRTSSASGEWVQTSTTACNGLVYSTYSSKFILLSNNNTGIWYSSNGSSWSQSNVTTGSFMVGAFNSSATVTGLRHLAGGSSSNGLWYSTNCTSWNQYSSNSALTTGNIWSIGFNSLNSRYIIGTETGLYYQSSSTIYFSTCNSSLANLDSAYFRSISDNGLTYKIKVTDNYEIMQNDSNLKVNSGWTATNLTSVGFRCIEYGNGIWVASCHSSGNSGLYYSYNGMTWRQSNITSGYCWDIKYANGYFVGGSYSGNGLYYTTDGVTWTQSSSVNSGNFNSITYANGIWIASSYDKGLWYATSPSSSWTNVISSALYKVYYGNGIFVTAGQSCLYYSSDGKSWTQSTHTSGDYEGICYANGIWVIGAADNIDDEDKVNGLWYSEDNCKTFTQSNITSNTYGTIRYANGVWIAVSSGLGGLYTSIDGKTWSIINDSTLSRYNYYDVYYANGVWVLGSIYSIGLYYSYDGMTWTQSNVTSGSFRCIKYANGIWVAGGDGGSYSKMVYYCLDPLHYINNIYTDTSSDEDYICIDNKLLNYDFDGTINDSDTFSDVSKLYWYDNIGREDAYDSNDFMITDRGIYEVDDTGINTLINPNIITVDSVYYENSTSGTYLTNVEFTHLVDLNNRTAYYSGYQRINPERPRFAQQSFYFLSSYFATNSNIVTIEFDLLPYYEDLRIEELFIVNRSNPRIMISYRNTDITRVPDYKINGELTNCIIMYENTDDLSVKKFYITDTKYNYIDTSTGYFTFMAPTGLIDYIKNNLTDIYDVYMKLTEKY